VCSAISTLEGTHDSSHPGRKRLTATVTATAATNGYQQRSTTAHNTRTINTLAYATPKSGRSRVGPAAPKLPVKGPDNDSKTRKTVTP
jgi:hypothetical protein